MLDGEYTTPLVAGYYYTYPIGFFDLTGVHVTDESVFGAPERQAFRAPGYPAYLAVLGGGGRGRPARACADRTGAPLRARDAAARVHRARLVGAGRRPRVGGGVCARPVLEALRDDPAVGAARRVPRRSPACSRTRAPCAAGTSRWWAATGALAGALTLVRAVFVFAVPLVVARRAAAARGAAAAAPRRRSAAQRCCSSPGSPGRTTRPDARCSPTGGRATTCSSPRTARASAGRRRRSPRIRRSSRDLERPHRYAPSREQLLRDPEAHPRYLARADAEVRSRAVERVPRAARRRAAAGAVGERLPRVVPLAGARGLVPAVRRRARRPAGGRRRSCSHWRSSASCSRCGAEVLRGGLRSSSSRTPS